MTYANSISFLSEEWQLTEDDARRIYSMVRSIPNDIDRMVMTRGIVAGYAESRGVPFSSFKLYDQTPDISRAIMAIGRS